MLLRILPFVVCAAAFAQEITVGYVEDVQLPTGASRSYPIKLHANDFLQIGAKTLLGPVTINILSPEGTRLRTASALPPNKVTISAIADHDGVYRIELVAPQPSTLHMEVERVDSLDARLREKPTPEAHTSPKIKALREAVAAGKKDAVDAFWKEIQTAGTPYVEGLDGDANNVLATFLWRATRETRNAVVMWAPFTFARMNDFRMMNIEGTDVWYRTLRVRRGARFLYQLSINDPLRNDPTAGPERIATSIPDPLNTKQRFAQSIAELSGAAPYTWSTVRAGVANGAITRHNVTSAIMKNTRNVSIYTPAGYSPQAKAYGVLVVFDEEAYLRPIQVPTNVILDNLIAAGRIPPLVAVLISNPSQQARGLELPCNPDYAEFLNTELVPWVRANWNVTRDPHHVTVAGSSYGGLAASWAAYRHPETFGNVLSQSGSYWWSPRGDPAHPVKMEEGVESGWLPRLFLEREKLDVKFYLDAGLFEVDLSGSGGSILVPNRAMRDILRAKGYEVHYQEFVGGHDYLGWRETLADGLLALLGNQAPAMSGTAAMK
ncbi:MAG: alpha/beta hydrolase-fold protein [Bryobacteraceae bacterium]